MRVKGAAPRGSAHDDIAGFPAGRRELMLRKTIRTGALLASVLALCAFTGRTEKPYALKAEIIEACSCNLFCMCYFNTHPDGERFCEFNNAFRVISGNVGDVKLDGEYFWVSGDLGGDFTKPLKSAILTFDAKTPKEKREAIAFLVAKLYPLPFEKFATDEAPISWKRDGLHGHAKLGDKAEVTLEGVKDASGKQSVIHNLAYWGAQKNHGFELAYGTHFYKGNGHDYKHTRRNGFFITVEVSGTEK
jgi:hypothetical protein